MRHLPLLLLLACTPEDAEDTVEPSGFDELAEQGMDRHLGAWPPQRAETTAGVTVHTFEADATDDGPRCLYGADFRVMTRPGNGEGLLVFLQGGGACWTGQCLAVPEAPPGIPDIELLDADLAANPTAGWDVVYVPYCDGSLFAGDAAIDEDDDGTIDRDQRGLANLSAALDVAAATFPDPERVVFAGASGGGYGTLLGLPLVRWTFPDTRIDVINDAGVGVAKPGDVGFLQRLIDEQNAASVIPASAEGLLDDGHVTDLATWQLDRDANTKIAMYSAWEDGVISDMFLGIGGSTFRGALGPQTAAVAEAHPDRFARFHDDSRQHTTTVGLLEGVIGELPPAFEPFRDLVELGAMEGTEVDGVTAATWLQQMLDDDPAWTSHVD